MHSGRRTCLTLSPLRSAGAASAPGPPRRALPTRPFLEQSAEAPAFLCTPPTQAPLGESQLTTSHLGSRYRSPGALVPALECELFGPPTPTPSRSPGP